MLAYYMSKHFVFDVLLYFLLVITYVSFVSSSHQEYSITYLDAHL